MSFTLDSSVYISALRPNDDFHNDSKKLMGVISPSQLVIPSLVIMETLTIIYKMTSLPIHPVLKEFQFVSVVNLDQSFISKALPYFNQKLKLKTSDLIICLTAAINHTTLLTWDKQLLKQSLCSALTPTQYLKNI